MAQIKNLIMEYDDKSVVLLSEDPFIAVIDNFLSAEECAAVICSAACKMQRAKVSLDKESVVLPGRTGENCWLRYADDPLINEIGDRVSRLVGLPLKNAESLQVLRYGESEEYRPHYDAYDLYSPKGKRCCKYGGQRLVTALLYLNNVEDGGGTSFPKLDVQMSPMVGRIVIFSNVGDDETRPHPDSLHAGMPVNQGEKWAANLWFHSRPMNEVQNFEPSEQEEKYLDNAPFPADSPLGEESKDFTDTGLFVKVNRASRVFHESLKLLERDGASIGESTLFTYWDTYGRSFLDISSFSSCKRIVRLVNRELTNSLSNKKQLARILTNENLDHWSPATYERVEDALNHPGFESSVWFVKPAFGSGGKGIFCLRGDDLPRFFLPNNCILQEGVDGIELIDGKKFTVRVYCFIWNGSVYLYPDGFVVIHGVDYVEKSTDYSVQVDHRGYERNDGAVKLLPSNCYERYGKFYPKVEACIRDIRPLFSEIISASDFNNYFVLGLDFLFLKSGEIRLIEINNMPNFIHSNTVNNEINIPFWYSVMRAAVTGDPSDFELIGVQEKCFLKNCEFR